MINAMTVVFWTTVRVVPFGVCMFCIFKRGSSDILSTIRSICFVIAALVALETGFAATFWS